MLPNQQEVIYEEFLKIDSESNDNLEFIDGKIYLLAAPSVAHQIVVTNLSTEFGNYFKGKKCRHFVAPFDVVLKDKEKTNRVKPDLTVICDKSRLGEQNYQGVPTLVVEVLSPSTASVDFIKKMDLYMKAGVKEYWIISPQNKTIQVFSLNKEGKYSEPTIYFTDSRVQSKVFEDLGIQIKDIFN